MLFMPSFTDHFTNILFVIYMLSQNILLDSLK